MVIVMSIQISELLLKFPFLSKEVFIVSPHSDDVCYSLAGFLKNIYRSALSMTICTVFSQSDYTLSSSKEPCVDLISAIRKREDIVFQNMIGHGIKMQWLDYQDAPLRGHNVELTCFVDKFTKSDKYYKEAFKKYVLTVLDKGLVSMIICPMAIGNHIDHLIVNQVITDLLYNGDLRNNQVLFYEDLPYANEQNKPDFHVFFNKISNKLGMKLFHIDINVEEHVVFKWLSIASYTSQMDLNDWCLIMRRLKELNGSERLYYLK